MDFSQKLKKLRTQHNITQEQLAEMISVSRQAVSKYESSHGYPDIEKIVLLSKIFKVSLDYLLTGETEIHGKNYVNIINTDKTRTLFNVLDFHYGITRPDIVSLSKDSQVVEARQVAMYLCYEVLNMSLLEISSIMGNREHITILHGIQVVKHKMDCERLFREKVGMISKEIMSDVKMLV